MRGKYFTRQTVSKVQHRSPILSGLPEMRGQFSKFFYLKPLEKLRIENSPVERMIPHHARLTAFREAEINARIKIPPCTIYCQKVGTPMTESPLLITPISKTPTAVPRI